MTEYCQFDLTFLKLVVSKPVVYLLKIIFDHLDLKLNVKVKISRDLIGK